MLFAIPDLLIYSLLTSVIEPHGPFAGVLGAVSYVTVPRFSIISLPIFYYLKKFTYWFPVIVYPLYEADPVEST